VSNDYDDIMALAAAAVIAIPDEGFEGAPYQDSGGVWTQGYGSTYDADGNRVTPSTPAVTKAQALIMLTRDMQSSLDDVHAVVKVPLSANEKGALVDLIYNIGVGNFNGSTLLRDLNAKNYASAWAQIMVWDEVNGTVLKGLLRRRQQEYTLAMTPDASLDAVDASWRMASIALQAAEPTA
jgi:lysozyme